MDNNKRKIAVVNFESTQDVMTNIDNIEKWLKKLVARGVDFVLFPELCITSYINSFSIHRSWDAIKFEAITKLNMISLNNPIMFSVGFPHDSHISQAIWSNGQMIGLHNKTKLGPSEKANFKCASGIDVTNIAGKFIGTSICYESHYPEISATYEDQGAHLLCFPFASPRETPDEKLDRFKIILRARAYDNTCFACACNSVGTYGDGKRYAGVALIVGPKGEIIAETSGYEEAFIEAEIDLDNIDRIKTSSMGYFRAKENFR
jgi:N-carbamoylputrescine amidase